MQVKELITILTDARRLVADPQNDFSWSSWTDGSAALWELDEAIAELRQGRVPAHLAVLFAPTGPMQELALSSGWGDQFLELADRFDRAIG